MSFRAVRREAWRLLSEKVLLPKADRNLNITFNTYFPDPSQNW